MESLSFQPLHFAMILAVAVCVGVYLGIGIVSLFLISKPMADDADRTQDRSELEAPMLIAASKKPPGPVANGRCHYCDMIVSDERRWCDADCRDAWSEYRQ